MRLCSAEGVLQPATCSKTREVSRRNSGGTSCHIYIKGRALPASSLPPKKALWTVPYG